MLLNTRIRDAIPARLVLAILIFTGCFVNYMVRNNLSVSIIAMVSEAPEPGGSNDTIASEVSKQETKELYWTAGEKAQVLGAYFYGYTVTSLLGGTAAERFGPRRTVFYTMLLSALMTAISPPAARIDYRALMAVRALLGTFGGFLWPALHALIAHWSPPEEKGKFGSALMGGAIGTVVTWSISGPLINGLGWEWAFYVPALVLVVWCILWWALIYDSPEDHPRILASEKKYILERIGDTVQQETIKILPPYKNMATSMPYLAMIVLHFGSNWGLYFAMTVGPTYISSGLGFKLGATGVLAALPYLARMIFSLGFGAVGDVLMRKKIMRTVVIRKFFSVFSHIIPGLLIIALVYSTNPFLSVALITISMGSNGAATLTNLVNHQDLAPNFAGTLYGIANGIGNTAGVISPLVAARYAGDSVNPRWDIVFYIGGTVYIVSALWFICFGSATTQSWNYIQKTEPDAEKSKEKSADVATTKDDTTIVVTKP